MARGGPNLLLQALGPKDTSQEIWGNVDEDGISDANITQDKSNISNTQHDYIPDNNESPLLDIANTKGFKFANININSLYRHIDEIRYMIM